MSKNVSTFLAATTTFLVALCIAVAGPGAGSLTSADDNPPPPATSTPAGTDGNPWHG